MNSRFADYCANFDVLPSLQHGVIFDSLALLPSFSLFVMAFSFQMALERRSKTGLLNPMLPVHEFGKGQARCFFALIC